MEWGATGDGTTDDATAIQAALDAADTANGGTVLFPQGRFAVGTTLSINTEVSLIGIGSDTISGARPVLIWIGAAGGTLAAIDNGSTHYRGLIENLVFRGGSGDIAGICLDIQKRFDSPGSIRNCQFQASTIANLRFGAGGTNVSLFGCRWDGMQAWGILVQGGSVSAFNLSNYTFDVSVGIPAKGLIYFDLADIESPNLISLRDGNLEINAAVSDSLFKLGRRVTWDDTQYMLTIDGLVIAPAGGLEDTFDLVRVWPAEGASSRSVAMEFRGVNGRRTIRDWWTGLPFSSPFENIRILSGSFIGDSVGQKYDYLHNASPEGVIVAPSGATCLVGQILDDPNLWVKESDDPPRLAQGTLTMDVQPINGDTFTLDGKQYTFETSLTNVDGNIAIGGSLAQAKLNLVTAIDLSGVAGTDYATAMTRHTTMSVAPFVTDDCVVSARDPGRGGNVLGTTETFDAVTNIFDAATLGTTTNGKGERGWRPATLNAEEVSGDTTLTASHGVVNVDTAGGAVVITVPDNGIYTGVMWMVRRDGANLVTLNLSGSDTFSDGDTTKTLDADDGAAIGFYSVGGGEYKIVGTEGTVGGS